MIINTSELSYPVMPVTFRDRYDRNLYRNEILGMIGVYDILYELATKSYDDMATLEQKIGNLREDHSPIDVGERLELLEKIGAVDSRSLRIRSQGRRWLGTLGDINDLTLEPSIELITPNEADGIPGFYLRILQKLLGTNSVKNLHIVSPWITFNEKYTRNLTGVIQQLAKEGIFSGVFVVTREPERRQELEALTLLKNLGANIFLNDYIHAKIYVIECSTSKASYAIVGSANLTTSAAERNFEVGIFLRGTNDANRTIIDKLITMTMDLKQRKW